MAAGSMRILDRRAAAAQGLQLSDADSETFNLFLNARQLLAPRRSSARHGYVDSDSWVSPMPRAKSAMARST
jgi:hypothetical protein